MAVAVWRGRELLLVRRSYVCGWVLPGGAAKRAESLLGAARRELAEETGIEADPKALVPAFTTAWIRIYEYCPVQAPALRVDGREIVEARFVDPDRFAEFPESLADYLRSRFVEGAPRRGVGG